MNAPASSPLSRRQLLAHLPSVGALSLGASLFPAKMLAATEPAGVVNSPTDLGARIYNVRTYGARGDGTTLDTAAVQAAIDACTNEGGGTVLVPAGTFQVGTIELKSNVTLHIAASGKLLGSAIGKNYHAVQAIPLNGDATLNDGNWALLFAVDAHHITIEGAGTIDGQGLQFHPAKRGDIPPSGIGGNQRPYHILLHRCEHVVIRDISLLESAYHSIRVIQSRHVRMDGLYIHNRVNGNNDGFHFISAQYVTVSNCVVLSQDDACALFGSCKYITVTNCVFSTRWSVFRFGGGVVECVSVSNCVLYQVFGCPIKIHGRPGDRFENMSFSNLVFQEVTGPINISIGPRQNAGPTAAEKTPHEEALPPAIARNISFNHIHGTVTTSPPPLPDYPFSSTTYPGELHSCITLNAVGGAVLEEISFNDVHLTFGGGGTAEDANRRELPMIASEYFALGPMPAYGFYARNARGLTLQNVKLQVSAADLRPAVILDHVENVSVNGLSVQGNPEAESVLRFIHVKDALLSATRVLTKSNSFLQIEGPENENITIDGGDLRKASAALALRNGAGDQAVKVRA